MKNSSWRDWERLSAYLDGQLSPRQRARLEARLGREAALRQALEELRRTRAWLQRLPKRRAPRNFVLTPRMVGLRPPLPRLVPILRWAALTALFLFFSSLAMPYVVPLVGAPKVPMPEAAIEAGTSVPQILAAPPPAEPTEAALLATTPPDETRRASAPSPTLSARVDDQEGVGTGQLEQPARTRVFVSLHPVQVIFVALTGLFFGISLLLGWHRQRAFRQSLRNQDLHR